MSDRSSDRDREELREKVVGVSERSLRKSHYSALLRSLRELEEKDRQIRQAYSDVIAAVTGGRLVILGKDELDASEVGERTEPFPLRDPAQLREARERLKASIGDLPFADDLLLAFSEAATNVLKHAGDGTYRIGRDDTRVQLVVSDGGPGIDFRQLPKATLTAGFSTAHTLGMGFTLMLELTDRVLLCTDPNGTTVVLEKDLVPATEPAEPAPATVGA